MRRKDCATRSLRNSYLESLEPIHVRRKMLHTGNSYQESLEPKHVINEDFARIRLRQFLPRKLGANTGEKDPAQNEIPGLHP